MSRITYKVKRLSVRDIKLPAPEPDIQPTAEEIAYSRLVAINPLLEELVDRLDLVSCYTGNKIRLVNIKT